MKKSICSRFSLFLILLFLISSCTTSMSTPIVPLETVEEVTVEAWQQTPTETIEVVTVEALQQTPTETIEEVMVEGWQQTSPESQGMDSGMLADMLISIHENDHAIDSVSILRNGYLVLDVAIYPYQAGSKHNIHSCTKSIVSALIGIAMNLGYIESVDQPLLDFFPTRTAANLDADKKSITLEHLLTMSSGWACRDSYLYRWVGLNEMRASEDWIQHMLDLPMAEKPGTTFEYCNGGSFMLSAILQESVDMNAASFAEEHLFGPLEITDFEWLTNDQGINIGWSALLLRPLDMAKIGQLFLDEGVWEGEQIIPKDWIKESTREYISATLEDGYGYQWWTDDSGFYLALGFGGQFIYVIPEKEMVVVFTSDLEEEDFYTPQNLLTDYIIPAAKSSSPLPDNPAGNEEMEHYIEMLEKP
jgi:CubicO group peptidase (beta-lactamase class C family)